MPLDGTQWNETAQADLAILRKIYGHLSERGSFVKGTLGHDDPSSGHCLLGWAFLVDTNGRSALNRRLTPLLRARGWLNIVHFNDDIWTTRGKVRQVLAKAIRDLSLQLARPV